MFVTLNLAVGGDVLIDAQEVAVIYRSQNGTTIGTKGGIEIEVSNGNVQQVYDNLFHPLGKHP